MSINVDDLLSGTAGTPADYTFTDPTTVTFDAGSGSETQFVTLTIVDDLLAEGSETVSLDLNTLVDPAGNQPDHSDLRRRQRQWNA